MCVCSAHLQESEWQFKGPPACSPPAKKTKNDIMLSLFKKEKKDLSALMLPEKLIDIDLWTPLKTRIRLDQLEGRTLKSAFRVRLKVRVKLRLRLRLRLRLSLSVPLAAPV